MDNVEDSTESEAEILHRLQDVTSNLRQYSGRTLNVHVHGNDDFAGRASDTLDDV